MARITLAEACNFDTERHSSIQKSVDDNAQLVQEVIDSIISSRAAGLDAIMSQAHAALRNSNTLETYEIEHFIMAIPLEIYAVTPALEYVGVKEDVSKMIRQRLYINARQDATGTVEDKNSEAERKVMQETLTAAANKHARSLLQSKVSAAYEAVAAFKKVLSRRMEEYQLSRYGGSSE